MHQLHLRPSPEHLLPASHDHSKCLWRKISLKNPRDTFLGKQNDHGKCFWMKIWLNLPDFHIAVCLFTVRSSLTIDNQGCDDWRWRMPSALENAKLCVVELYLLLMTFFTLDRNYYNYDCLCVCICGSPGKCTDHYLLLSHPEAATPNSAEIKLKILSSCKV